eukprot:gb/GEZN01000932.1/.p1 GENE.gb/GEZN01000932.1/~~gb/GEZN01000932.1/.p1  ORF type:complete len:979 (+),score=174.44 gb/GEZN01000932.1/:230-3166(+)
MNLCCGIALLLVLFPTTGNSVSEGRQGLLQRSDEQGLLSSEGQHPPAAASQPGLHTLLDQLASLELQINQYKEKKKLSSTVEGSAIQADQGDRSGQPNGPAVHIDDVGSAMAELKASSKESAGATESALAELKADAKAKAGAAAPGDCLLPPFTLEIVSSDVAWWGGTRSKITSLTDGSVGTVDAGSKMTLVYQAGECDPPAEGKLRWVSIVTDPGNIKSKVMKAGYSLPASVELTNIGSVGDILGSCGVAPKLGAVGIPKPCPAGTSYPEQLYAKLQSLYGNENQLLTFEWPGRVLDEKTYQFQYQDAYSNFLKPVSIQDAEFRLSDDLFPLAQVTGGPSGMSLSTLYETATNMLLESTEYPPDGFLAEKRKARAFLAKKVDNRTVMDKHTAYFNNYVNVTARWKWILHDLKQKQRTNLPSDSNERDALADEIVLTNSAAAHEMNAAWKDLVVQGLHHEVLSALSVLDVESPGELLQQAKDSLRNSGRSSLDSSETIYPISFQPQDWASLLTTAFTPVDLMMEPNEALAQVAVLQDQRVEMQDQLTALTTSGSIDIDKLKGDHEAKLKVYQEQFQLLIAQVGGSSDTATLVMLFCAKDHCKAFKDSDFSPSLTGLKILPFVLQLGQEVGLAALVQTAVAAEQAMMRAAAELSSAQTMKALASSDVFNERVTTLSKQIDDITEEINTLSSAYSAVVAQRGSDPVPFDDDKDFYPSMPKPGPWARVILTEQKTSSDISSTASSFSKSDSEQTKSGGGCFIVCEQRRTTETSSYSAQASSKFSAVSSDSSFAIAFEAAKVTIDRGGWFKPEFLEHSDLFMKFTAKNISRGRPSGNDWKNATKLAYYRDALLPSFPAAFVLARDITIKIVNKNSDVSWENDMQFRSDFSKSAETATSFLGFGGGTTTKQSSSGGYVASGTVSTKIEKDALIIKIAGAQIIMWIQNYISADKAKPLVARGGGNRPGYDVLDLLEEHPPDFDF